MPNTVTLADGKQFVADSDQTLLEAAKKDGIVIEHSCRTGRCGVCKVKVVTGTAKALKSQESLSEQETKEGFILTCCCAADSDLELDTEDLGELGAMQAKILPCRIDHLYALSSDVLEVTLRTPPNSSLHYLPGQYVDMISNTGIRRSYSIANAPREDGKITLQIRKVEHGQLSHYWFNDAQVNDLLRMEGPLGTFCLRKRDVSNLVLLATGTGFAPIKAILEQLSANSDIQAYEQIHLYWGGRTEHDIYWSPEFPSLPIRFVPVLSRTENWQGRKGYIQQAVIEDGINLKDSVVYACGSEAMIHSAHERLKNAGLQSKCFYSDAFVSSN